MATVNVKIGKSSHSRVTIRAMKIIPVIDILDGEVVHGIAGNREHYQPIESRLCDSSLPERVVQGFLNLYPFERIYIADLNSLQRNGDSTPIVTSLVKQFPNVAFLVDAGFETKIQLDNYATDCTFVPILATEAFSSTDQYLRLRNKLADRPYILSLDHQNGRLGPSDIFDNPAFWPDEVIVMSLDDVGSNSGPALELISNYQTLRSECQFIAAGGVRNNNDINVLATQKVSAALVASALHAGRLSAEELTFLGQKNAPR